MVEAVLAEQMLVMQHTVELTHAVQMHVQQLCA